MNKTLEQFKEEAKSIHNNKYDYSKVNYINSKTKVEIICHTHGAFFQTPADHLRGHGCPSCAGLKKITKEEFISRSKKIHNDKYDYSKVNYVNRDTKIEIICPVHGSFFQTPRCHLRGNGCISCSGLKRSTNEEFISKANKIHNNKYNYKKIDYKNNSTKVKIGCPVHGDFLQTPRAHLNGQGCPKCGLEKQVCSRTSSKEEFIAKAIKIHGDNYIYSEVDYINSSSKVKIICKKHGEFFQTPRGHLSGKGCSKCASENIGLRLSFTKEDFLRRAISVHGDKYDYSKANYNGSKIPVEIICAEHGSFFQQPVYHIRGNGCPKCAKAKIACTSGTSSEEEFLNSLLNEKYKILKRGYNQDERYPFPCDFYIPQRDLFVEYNGHWTHGKSWFSKRKRRSKEILKKWENKSSAFYKRAIRTYTVKDPEKRRTAKSNQLNYVALWDKEDIEKWFVLGCPDGHDYDFEYSWIPDEKERKEWIKHKKR